MSNAMSVHDEEVAKIVGLLHMCDNESIAEAFKLYANGISEYEANIFLKILREATNELSKRNEHQETA